MDRAFRGGKLVEDRQRTLAHSRGQGAAEKHGADVAVGAMPRLRSLGLVVVAVRMVGAVLMVVIVGRVGVLVLFAKIDDELRGADAALFPHLSPQGVALQWQVPELGLEVRQVEPAIEERTDDHVSRKARKRVQISESHQSEPLIRFHLYSQHHAMVVPWITSPNTMNKRDLKFFKELLLERRVELLKEAGRSVDGMSDDKENFPDPTDRAALEFNRNFMLRIRDRERKLITKIDEALQRIELGTYGLCEECEEDIGVERMKARPVTTLCIDCKAAQEANEKKIGA
jgi:DnaK suppressor protein